MGLSGGVGKMEIAVAMRVLSTTKHGHLPASENETQLIVAKDGTCRLYEPLTKTYRKPKENTKYVFVTMKDGTVRVSTKSENGDSAHFRLSGHAAYVRCAGELYFSSQGISRASVQTGTYLTPLATASERSGLNCPFVLSFDHPKT
jgi:hypothetical protein